MEETNYNIFDLGFNKFLTKGSSVLESEIEKIADDLSLPSILGSGFYEIPPSQIGSGEMAQNITLVAGLLKSSNFVTGSSGWQILYDGTVEFNSGTFRGSLVAASIHIPDENATANSFHADSDGNTWWGCTHTNFDSSNDNAAAYILKTGVAKFQSITVTGGTIAWSTVAGTSNAPANNATVGAAFGSNISGGGSGTNQVGNNGYLTTITATSITTGTLDAVLVRSADANTRIELNPTEDAILLYQNANLRVAIGSGLISFLTSAGVGSGEIYGVSTNKMGMNVDGAYAYYWDGSGFYPSTPGVYDLGLSTNEWGNIYAQGSLYDGAGNHETIANIVAGVGGFSCSDLNSCNLTNIGTRAHSSLTGIGANDHHTKTGLDDTPVNGQTSEGITSNWAYDHKASASAHHSSISNNLNITPYSVYLVDGTHKVYGPYTSIIFETSGSSSGGMTIDGGNNGVKFGSLIYPQTSNSYDLGTSSYYWQDVYLDYLRFNSSYARIYNGAGLALDFYADTIRSSENWCPASAGSQSLGTATYYWADVSYKTLSDRGCLGWFEDGVELQDGRKVSDIEALKSIQKHPTLETIYGVPRFDYKTMPKAVYRKADDGKGNILPRDTQDKPYSIDEKTKQKVYAEDGAEITALISIMIGAIKELETKYEELSEKIS